MELMSMQDVLNLIEKYKKIYTEEYKDIKLQHGGSPLRDTGGKAVTLGELERCVENKPSRLNPENVMIIIGETVLLKGYELLDSDTINIHSPNATIII